MLHRLLSLSVSAVILTSALPAHALVWRSDLVPRTESGMTIPENPTKPITRKVTTKIIKSEGYVRRNNQRKTDLTNIATAIFAYRRDHQNKLPKETIPFLKTGEICRFDAVSCKGLVDLRAIIKDKYLKKMPVDPDAPKGNGTGYFITKDRNDRVTLTAPSAEDEWRIRVQK